MAVNNVEQSAGDKAQEQEAVKTTAESLSNDLMNSLDLPEDLPTNRSQQVDETGGEEVEEIQEELEEAEEELEKASEDLDDDVISKSEHERILKKQQRRIAQLTAKLHAQEEAPPVHTGDPDMDRLNKMSIAELRQTKLSVRQQQFDPPEGVTRAELLALEDKIDEAITSLPKRFEAEQKKLYDQKAQEIIDSGDIQNLDEASPKILAIAKDIYTSNPELQKSKSGQAIALGLAKDHYIAIQQVSSGKDKISDLKRKNTTLKRKTALDTSNVKGSAQSSKLTKLQERAFRGGDSDDKINLVKNDPRFGVDKILGSQFKE